MKLKELRYAENKYVAQAKDATIALTIIFFIYSFGLILDFAIEGFKTLAIFFDLY